MKKLKVLISAYACNPSGSIRLHPGEDLTGWKLTEQMARRHHVWVLSHIYNKPGIEAALKDGHAKNVKFIFISLPRLFAALYRFGIGERLYYYFWQVAAWRAARRLHIRHHFDIAHHLTFGNYWMPSFIGAFLPIPFIWGPVGGGQKTPAQLFHNYSLYGQFAEIGRDLAQWMGRNILVSRRLCLHRAAAILVCNRETKLQFPKRYWPRIQYFPVNGISPEDLTSPSSPITRSTFRILTAGRLIRLKGFDICLEAFSRFVKLFPNSRFAIVGEGPQEVRLRQWTIRNNLEDRVRFVKWLDRRRLLKKMRDSDVFIFASFRDGGGAVVVEAMASGLPVICLDTGGPGFHIRKGWGLKIKPGSKSDVVEAMTRALAVLKARPALRKKLGRAAKKRAGVCYLWNNLGRRLDETYRRVFQEKAGYWKE
jgi:glycosyltransferase involved in cell wall biosynthesis